MEDNQCSNGPRSTTRGLFLLGSMRGCSRSSAALLFALLLSVIIASNSMATNGSTANDGHHEQAVKKLIDNSNNDVAFYLLKAGTVEESATASLDFSPSDPFPRLDQAQVDAMNDGTLSNLIRSNLESAIRFRKTE